MVKRIARIFNLYTQEEMDEVIEQKKVFKEIFGEYYDRYQQAASEIILLNKRLKREMEYSAKKAKTKVVYKTRGARYEKL